MLTVYTLSDAAQWDKIVRSFREYDVYYLSGYVKAFQLHGDGEPLLFHYEGNGLRGINAVMKRDVAQDPHFARKLSEGKYFDFATPYGYGGWLTEGEGEGEGDKSPLFAAYVDWCRKNGIVSEFTRFSLFSGGQDCYYGQTVSRQGNIVRSLDLPVEEIFSDFEHKVRKNVKRAEASGLRFLADLEGERLEDFLSIYYRTMDRNHAEAEYYFKEDFFRQLNSLAGNRAFFHVLLEDKVISTELALLGSRNMYSYLGGTDSAYFQYRPNDFLKWHMIRWGAARGFNAFVLGGGYGSDDGIYRYKKSFAPHGAVNFRTGQAIFDQANYDELLSMRTDRPEDSGFFPRYRA